VPFPQFHAARQHDPGQYVRIRIAKNRGGKGIDFIFGFKKGGGSEVQSVRFDKSVFTPAQAKKWLKDHGFSSGQFETATKEAMTITAEGHTPSHDEIRSLIDQALSEKYPSSSDDYWRRFLIYKVWDGKALLQKGYYSKHADDPNWALIDYDVDEGSEDSIPSVTLGDIVPVSIQAVPKDGGDGFVIDEAGRRNANSDASKINQAIRALIATLNDDDLEEETINALNSKMMGPINGEGDFQDFGEAKWTKAFINSLPDSAFAIISSGGSKDSEGKTVPRSLRHLPYKNANGIIDKPHLRNALARLNQTNLTSEEKAKARRILQAAAKRSGVGDSSKESEDYIEKDTITEAWTSLPGETFTEAFGSALSEAEIDYDNLILKNVVVLGPTSSSGRKYSVDTQQKALPLFEGIRAYVNHPKLNEMSEPRDMRDLIGEHKNLRIVVNKTVSDLYLIDNATVRDVVLPLAEQKPHLAGNSIVARGKIVKEKDGSFKVEEILAARSIDIVTEPATTNNLFIEGKQFLLEEEDMEIKNLTMETLKRERPDLFEAINVALEAELADKNKRESETKILSDKVTALEAKVTKLETDVTERDKTIATYELEKAKAQKDALVNKLFGEAKIPDSVKLIEKDGVKTVNPRLLSLLEKCDKEEDMKELISVWEEAYQKGKSHRQGPISEEKKLDFGPNSIDDKAIDRVFRAVA